MTDTAPWLALLQKSLKANYSVGPGSSKWEPVAVQVACIRSDGSPSIQPLTFQGLLDVDHRVPLFSAPTRNGDLMGSLKNSNHHDLHWFFPKTSERYVLRGRLFTIAAPNMSHRFGQPPRKIHFSQFTASNGPLAEALKLGDDFWEGERLKAFKAISASYRASFSWPAPGDPVSVAMTKGGSPSHSPSSSALGGTVKVWTGINYGLQHKALDYIAPSGGDGPSSAPAAPAKGMGAFSLGGLVGYSSAGSGGSTPTSSAGSRPSSLGAVPVSEAQALQNSSLDNFSLLPLRVEHVDYLRGDVFPAQRFLFQSLKDSANSWKTTEVYPY